MQSSMMWKKGLVVATITLFFGLAVVPAGGLSPRATSQAPSAQATCVANSTYHGQELAVVIDEYRPDGTIVTRELLCTRDDIERMSIELAGADGIEETVMVLASHDIISAGEARNLMAAVREQCKTAEQNLNDIWLPPLSIMFFSEVSTTFRWGGTVRLGMTPFLRLINRFLKTDLQRGIDIVDVCWGLRGSLHTRGLLGEHRLSLRPGAVCLVGFIGYGIHIPLLWHSFYGSTVMTMAAGLGEHDFDPWFP